MINNKFDVKYFVGVVEDRNDPMKLGRVKVRVFSLHTKLKHKDEQQGISTSDLLWMYVIQPITSAAVSGIGTSPVGVVLGSHVFGLYLDKYFLNGVVLGTYGGVNSSKANTNYGFYDPLGVYPKSTGVDTNNLALGGVSGNSDKHVVLQNKNLDIGLNPSGSSDSEIPDNNPDISPLEMLERDEGVRTKLYWDSLGYPTIGIGHLILAEQTRDMNKISTALTNQLGRQVYSEISIEDVSILFNKDYQRTINDISEHSLIGPIYNKQNASRKLALVNMAFQMGVNGLSKFTKSLSLIDQEKYKEAGVELRNSLWYNQTLGRATRVIRIIETGNMESYGVVSKQEQTTFRMLAANDPSPEDPFTPADSRIMFKEPPSPYKGEYPYNKVHQTEGGHLFEIDDTPGHERIHNRHTSGTYEEIGPDGTKVTKVVKDNYTLVHGNDSILVEGDVKLVISKNSNVYIMGNVNQTIDGNVNQTIRGNNISLIEGNSTTTINGNLNATVKGNVDSLIEGNLTAEVIGDSVLSIQGNHTETVQGNYTKLINGNYSLTVTGNIIETTSSNWNRMAVGSVYDIASAVFTIDAPRINLG